MSSTTVERTKENKETCNVNNAKNKPWNTKKYMHAYVKEEGAEEPI